MKIAFIYKYFPGVGGVERVMTILANEMKKRGEEIFIYSFHQNVTEPFYKLNAEIEIVCLPDKENIDSAVNTEFLVADLLVKNINILFNHDTTADSMRLCAKIRQRLPVPLITLHHGPVYFSWLSLKTIVRNSGSGKSNLRRLFFPLYYLYCRGREYFHHKQNIKSCDAYIMLSDYFKRQLSCDPKVKVIANPLSFDTFFDMRRYEKKENLIVMVGRISEFHKRFILALKVWQKIEQDSRFDSWRLEIAGDGPDLNLLKNEILNLKLRRIRLLGNTDPLPLYQRAKIFFMTSSFEGFPLVLTEALQNACVPIVMDSFGALHDIVNNKNGIIVPNNRIDLFYKATEMLICRPDKLQDLAKFAVVDSRRFESATIVDKWMDLLNNLVK